MIHSRVWCDDVCCRT